MKRATSPRGRNSWRVTALALPLALMTWVGVASATGLETQPSPAVSYEGRALVAHADGHALVAHQQSAEPDAEGLGLRVRGAATSGWEWGAGSAGIAAWLLGLGRRWQRSKA
jgi:hypothetical protein